MRDFRSENFVNKAYGCFLKDSLGRDGLRVNSRFGGLCSLLVDLCGGGLGLLVGFLVNFGHCGSRG